MNKAEKIPETIPFQYQVVCKHCHKTIFFSGQGKGETIYALCEKCSQFIVEPKTHGS